MVMSRHIKVEPLLSGGRYRTQSLTKRDNREDFGGADKGCWDLVLGLRIYDAKRSPSPLLVLVHVSEIAEPSFGSV